MEIIDISRPPDYRSFVDPDIAAMFEGNKMYYSWEMLLAQLVKELRLQRLSSRSGDTQT